MKLGLIVSLLALIGCSQPSQITPTYPPLPENHPQSAQYYNLPPTDLDLTINDRKPSNRPIIIRNEDEQYRNSLRKIRETIETEYLNYTICLSVKPKQECDAYLKEVCRVDVQLDSRGVIHKKPYCR